MKTKQPIYLYICLLCYSLTIDAQKILHKTETEPSTFIKHLGDKGINRGVTVEEIADGGYIITGFTTGSGAGVEDVLLIKTNVEGDTLWTKTIGGKGKDNGWAVRQTDNGGYIIVGFTDSFGAGGMDVYLVKTDAEGHTIWTKTYGGEGDEFGWDIRKTADKGYIIAAQTNSSGNGEIDAYLIKIDTNGNEQWSKTYGGSKIDRIFSVNQTPDAGYIAAGITYSYSSVGPQDRDAYLLKTDPSGKQEWYKTFGGDDYDVGHSVACTNDGGYLITGYGESFATSGKRDVYLIKTNIDGKGQWTKAYGGSDDERGIKGLQTKDGGYIAIGFTDKNLDVFLVKTTNAGDVLWTRTFGDKDKLDFGYTVRETSDGGYILLGHSEDLNGVQGYVLLIKTDSEGFVKQNN